MTLCLTWKQADSIYFASDSRLMGDDQIPMTDEATKIFKIQYEIIYNSYVDQLLDEAETVKKKSDINGSFGLCFSGSYINGSNVADTISDVLSNIQADPEHSDISMESLSNIAFNIYKKTSAELMLRHREKGLSNVLFGGFCPKNNDFKLYKFFYKMSVLTCQIEFFKEFIEIKELEPIMIGDDKAKQKVIELLPKVNDEYTFFHLFRDIIQDIEIPNVGGNIQAGKFTNQNFTSCGIAYPELYQDDFGFQSVREVLKFRGFEFAPHDEAYINIRRIHIAPFKDDYLRLTLKASKLMQIEMERRRKRNDKESE